MSLSFELSRPRKGLWAEGGWGGKDGLMVVEMGGEEERDRTDYYLALHRLYGHSMVSFESPPFPLRAQLVRSCSSFQLPELTRSRSAFPLLRAGRSSRSRNPNLRCFLSLWNQRWRRPSPLPPLWNHLFLATHPSNYPSSQVAGTYRFHVLSIYSLLDSRSFDRS